MHLQLRERLHDLIFEHDSSGAVRAVIRKDPAENGKRLPLPHLLQKIVAGARPRRISSDGSRPGPPTDAVLREPAGKFGVPLLYSLPDVCGACMSPNHLSGSASLPCDDPDLMWLDDALIENLIGTLYPKDPNRRRSTPAKEIHRQRDAAKPGR